MNKHLDYFFPPIDLLHSANQSVPVALKEVIASTEFTQTKSETVYAVGKDSAGNCIIGDIAKLPHLLIGGDDCSGKTVFFHSVILSLLYKASPDDVKMILIDPKMVNFGVYNGLPNLLLPVIMDARHAVVTLQWLLSEMIRRYQMMSDAGVRNLDAYNMTMDSEPHGRLPKIVVLVDEFSDLMLVAEKEAEEAICRLAQLGRAAGIHLMIATNRPSNDVITGLIKANIPSRIAFKTQLPTESRRILDTQGAETLNGSGDMLYTPIGCTKPLRVQGCFVSDEEVETVTNHLKENNVACYDQTVMEQIHQMRIRCASQSPVSESAFEREEPIEDELLPAAVEEILTAGWASVSMLQRRLMLGYARAARIMDALEARGIVGPMRGSTPREVLVTREQWNAMNAGSVNGKVMD